MVKNSLAKNRNDGIDLLRGICIIAVILLHCRIHIPFDHSVMPQWLYNIVFGSGYYGVIIFFVISGFLITSHCLQRWGNFQNIHAQKFYKMRFARIMPCLLALLIISSVLDLSHVNGFIINVTKLSPALFAARHFHNTTLPHALFAALTFHINYLEAKVMHRYLPGNWDVLWSLSVEEAFYLFFPVLCLLCIKPRYFITTMILFVLISIFARTFSHPEMWQEYSYLGGMGGVAIGCLAALFSHQKKISKKLFSILLSVGLFLFLLIFVFRHVAFEMDLTKINMNATILEIGVGLILIAMQEWYSDQNNRGAFWLKPIRFFGRNSYEIYLTHMFIVLLAARIAFHTTTDIFIEYAAILILCAILGHAVSSYFSEPMNIFLRKKNFLKYQKIESHV